MFILIPFIKRKHKYFKIYVLLLLVIFYGIIYNFLPNFHFENTSHKKKNKNNNFFNIKRFAHGMYTSIIIQSTVGLGDVVPITTLSQTVLATQAITTLIITAM